MEKETGAMSCTILNDLRLEGRFCDVVIKVNSTEFNAHKAILCGCSAYFRTLFHRWSDLEKPVYIIPGVSPGMMQLIIEYAYTRFVPVTAENVEELLVAADQLLVTGIIGACSDFLEGHLSLENCVSIWRFADIYCCPDLWRKAHLFIVCHFEEMLRVSQEFVELSLQQLVDIIERDDLNVKSEETVFEAVLHWIDHSREERKTHIPLLLPKVRMGLMRPDYFLNNVQNNPVVRDSHDCRPLILSVLNPPSSAWLGRLRRLRQAPKPLTHPRLPQEVLLAIGGYSGEGPTITNGMEAYDIRAGAWMDVSAEAESDRAFHGTTYLHGLVYCVGGFAGVECFSSVRRFNPVTRSWLPAAPMHSCRDHVSVVALGGCIYAMGGYDGYVELNTAECYEPETNQWTLISPMLEYRSGAGAAALHGKVYICGGFDGTECLFTAECYSPDTKQWTLIAPMSSRRAGVGVAAYRGQVYVVGGFDGENDLRSAEAYSPLTDSWRTLPTMLTARCDFGIGVLDDLLFVAGGYNGLNTTLSNVERYDQSSDRWTVAEDMKIQRGGLSCCIMHGLPNMSQYAAPRGALQ